MKRIRSVPPRGRTYVCIRLIPHFWENMLINGLVPAKLLGTFDVRHGNDLVGFRIRTWAARQGRFMISQGFAKYWEW